MPARTKTINGNDYLYYIYYKDGKKKDVYCGIASKPESEKKVLQMELDHVRNQSLQYTKIANKLEARIKKL